VPGPPYLFVYGTLRRGLENQFSSLLAANAEFVDEARMPGRMYDFGWHPVAVPSGEPDEWVHGEVFRLNDAGSSILETLDRYEGPEFGRVSALVTCAAGPELKAWVYVYQGTRTGHRILSGNWLAKRSLLP